MTVRDMDHVLIQAAEKEKSMKLMTVLVTLGMLSLLSLPVSAAASGGDPCKVGDRRLVVDAAIEKRIGDRVTGPACVEIRNVNTLRYDVKIGQTITFPAGPDLKLSFIPNVAKAGGGSAEAVRVLDLDATAAARAEASKPAPNPTQALFADAVAKLAAAQTDWLTALDTLVTTVDKTNAASAAVENLMAASDSMLAARGSTTLAEAAQRVQGTATQAVGTRWPTHEILRVATEVREVTNALKLLPAPVTAAQWQEWSKDAMPQYDRVLAEAAALSADVATYEHGSNTRKAYDQARAALSRWVYVLQGISKESFVLRHRAGCGAAFAANREASIC